MINISKRHRFVISSLILSAGFLFAQTVNVNLRYQSILILTFLSLLLTLWSLKENLNKVKFFTVMFLPVVFTASSILFYFLLPVRWLTRLPMAFLFGVGMYFLLLTENIYNVSAIRSIQLLRAAHATGFLFTLITSFFLFEVLFSLHLDPVWIFPAAAIICFPLILQNLWSFDLEDKILTRVWSFAFLGTLTIAEMALALSFWPVTVTVAALFLVTCLYIFLGLLQHFFAGKLNGRTMVEHLIVGVAVFLVTFITTKWGG